MVRFHDSSVGSEGVPSSTEKPRAWVVKYVSGRCQLYGPEFWRFTRLDEPM